MRKLCIVYVILLISTQLFSQERIINGTVKDQDGNPIESVTVKLKGSEISVQTDINGTFEIKVPTGDYTTLTFSHPGKEEASATIGLYDELEIEMNNPGEGTSDMSLEELLNMDVTTASKSAEKLSDAPGVISVLTKDDLSRFGGTTLLDVLERIPGLATSTAYMTDRFMIAARGDQIQATSTHILLLINGRPLRESLEGGIKTEILESFPVNIIERIEVIKGPGSVLYSSTAFTGVINIITEKAKGFDGSVSGLGGAGGEYGTSGKIKHNSGDFSVVAAGNYLKKPDWKSTYSVTDTTVPISVPYDGRSAFINTSYKNLNMMLAYAELTEWFTLSNWLKSSNAYGDAFFEKLFANVGYDQKITGNITSSFNVTYTKSYFRVHEFPDIKRNSDDIVAEITNFITINDKSKVVIGGLFNRIQGGETCYLPIPYIADTLHGKISNADRNAYALYVQIDYRILKNLKAIAGYQVNKIESLDVDFVPRVGIIWYPVPKINVKAIYSGAYRAPSINEFNLKHVALKGNPSIKPEKVTTMDLSISYRGEQAQVTISAFRSLMTNIIDQVPWNGTQRYENIGDITSTGLEVESKYYMNNNLYLVASLLTHETIDTSGNEDITPIAKFGAKGGISYSSKKGISVSLFDIYQGDLSNYFKNTPNIDPGAYNILNLLLKMDLNKLLGLNIHQKIGVELQADNLLNKEIWLPNWGEASHQSLPFRHGREIYFGINLNF